VHVCARLYGAFVHLCHHVLHAPAVYCSQWWEYLGSQIVHFMTASQLHCDIQSCVHPDTLLLPNSPDACTAVYCCVLYCSQWWEYLSLTRVYRHLTTQLAHPAVRAQQISFSGYPGQSHTSFILAVHHVQPAATIHGLSG
jgi:hypothetical protein